MSLHNKSGDVLYKRMFFKVIIGEKQIRFDYVAPGHMQGFPPSAIVQQLTAVVDHIDKSFPKLDFRMVELAPNRFNFVCTGDRKVVTLAEIRGEK
jgi:hypothetical protein